MPKYGIPFCLAMMLGGPIGLLGQEADFPVPKHGSTYVIAHRGAHDILPENTLAAYRRAIDLGCDFVEVDARKSWDGVLVSVHNATVDAYTSDIKGKVSDFTLAELQALKLSRSLTHPSEERIPSLEEVFRLCRGKIGIYLDVKEPYIAELVALVRRYGMERQVVWYIPGDYEKEIQKVKERCPECLPMPDLGALPQVDAFLDRVRPEILASDMDHLDAPYMAAANKRNLSVFVDDQKGTETEWAYMLSLGVSGIQTDTPLQLIDYLEKRAQKP